MKSQRPPGFISRLIEWYCDPSLTEGILGDLDERYHESVQAHGNRKAKFLYVLQSLGFLRLIFKKNHQIGMTGAIWTNYFKTSLRSIMRRKTYFGINLVGLICAVTCALFTYVFVQDELKFDHFHADNDQIYRLYKRHLNEREGIDLLTAETSGMMGPTIHSEYPEVRRVVRLCPWWDPVPIFVDEERYLSQGWYFADSTFFDVFDFRLLKGDPSKALVLPQSAVISESLASRLYGNTEPLGQTFTGFGEAEYVVTGIVEDVPRHSTLQFDILVSWTTTVPEHGRVPMTWMNNWLAQGIYTFVVLDAGISPDRLIDKLPDMMQRFFPERADQYFLRLQPFTRVHLHSDNIRNQRGMDLGSMRFISVLVSSTLLIVLIVMVNYINISLSRSTESRLEVGIRKVLGSTRWQLLWRFVLETFVSTLAASIIGLLLLTVLLPRINLLTGNELPVSALYQPFTVLVLLAASLLFSILMGLYPAIIMSRPRVSTIMKSSMASASGTGIVRKSLLGLQFAIATALIVCTIGIIQQTSFLKNKPLGFDRENVIVVDIDNEVGQKSDVFEAELERNPDIASVSVGRSALGAGSYSTTFIPEGGTDELGTRIFIVDPEFFQTYGISTTQGRTFLRASTADSSNVIVNQSLVDMTSWDDPIGKRLKGGPDGPSYPVIGVVEDFHYNSLATATIEPMAIFLSGPKQNNNVSIRLREDADLNQALTHIQNAFDGLATKTPFEYYFVDQWFENLYVKEAQLITTTAIYSIICILLCALGLYGLTALLLRQRMREIGIRKVLGADTGSIIRLMGRKFVPIILISLLVAAPAGYWVLQNWLKDYAYAIELGAQSIAVAAFVILALSVCIISVLCARAAGVNPVVTMRSE